MMPSGKCVVMNITLAVTRSMIVPPRIQRATKHGMSLVELLVVMGIIGVVTALVLSAVQAARETARRATCKNNLRQIGIALQSHHATYSRFPSNGWGFRWMGDPAGGPGAEQPGGWIYNLLPYLEQESLHGLGRGVSGVVKEAQLTQVMHTPVRVLHCPSRRTARLYPYLGKFALHNVARPESAAKCDYAGNGGTEVIELIEGPSALTPAAVASYAWPDTRKANGVFYVRSMVRMADIADGTSQTYLVGEKHVSTIAHDSSNRDRGDDQTAYIGDDIDIRRWTDTPPQRDSRSHASLSFGSAHGDGCHFVFVDGAVHFVRYGISSTVHERLGNRTDGQSVDLGEL